MAFEGMTVFRPTATGPATPSIGPVLQAAQAGQQFNLRNQFAEERAGLSALTQQQEQLKLDAINKAVATKERVDSIGQTLFQGKAIKDPNKMRAWINNIIFESTDNEDATINVADAVELRQMLDDPAQGIDAVKAEIDSDLEQLIPVQARLNQMFGIGTGSAGQRERADLLKDLNSGDPDTVKSAQIKLGLKPRAVGSAVQTITEEGTAEDIGDTEAVIAQRKKFGELTGTSRAKAIDSGFENIQKIDKNIRNMGRAITAIDEGASTGVIESRFFPSFRKSTLQLEALRKELALDVIGSVTFGALSQGELDLAQEVALPTNLEPADLKDELARRIAAQEKLRGYYQEQIDHLDTGGTIASFMRSKSRGAAEPAGAAPPGVTAQPQVDLSTLSDEQLLQLKSQVSNGNGG